MFPPSSSKVGRSDVSATIAAQLRFIEKFCAFWGVSRLEYHDTFFARACPPHARLLRPVVETVSPNFFAADHLFIVRISHTTGRDDFTGVARDFAVHSANRRFLRRVLRCRLSLRRAKRIFDRTWLFCDAVAALPPPAAAGYSRDAGASGHVPSGGAPSA